MPSDEDKLIDAVEKKLFAMGAGDRVVYASPHFTLHGRIGTVINVNASVVDVDFGDDMQTWYGHPRPKFFIDNLKVLK